MGAGAGRGGEGGADRAGAGGHLRTCEKKSALNGQHIISAPYMRAPGSAELTGESSCPCSSLAGRLNKVSCASADRWAASVCSTARCVSANPVFFSFQFLKVFSVRFFLIHQYPCLAVQYVSYNIVVVCYWQPPPCTLFLLAGPELILPKASGCNPPPHVPAKRMSGFNCSRLCTTFWYACSSSSSIRSPPAAGASWEGEWVGG